MSEASCAFTCRRCGHCCQGEGGIVLTHRDQERLSAHLGMSVERLLAEMAETRGGKVTLRSGEDAYCLFFKDGCSIHQARPDICRAWPFFKGNLEDDASWEMIQDYCPGVNPEASHEEFARQGLAYLKEHGLVKKRADDAPEALTLE